MYTKLYYYTFLLYCGPLLLFAPFEQHLDRNKTKLMKPDNRATDCLILATISITHASNKLRLKNIRLIIYYTRNDVFTACLSFHVQTSSLQ